MPKTIQSFAETTNITHQNDCLSDVLKSMRISGTLLFRETYGAPWAVAVPHGERLATLLKVRAGVRVVAFHFVERGHMEITLQRGRKTIVEAGEMAICFSGTAHQISQGSNPRVVSVETLLTGGGNEFRPSEKSGARSTLLMCGVFLLDDTHLNPLFAALPPLLHASVSQLSEFHNLSGVAGLMAQELNQRSVGSGYVIARLLELLCAEAVRSHIATVPQQAVGWLRGLTDPVVGRAIAMIHARPSENWSVRRLAEGVAMSPSRFAARFTGALGESPMAYVGKWRMNVAGRLLDATQRGISDIATDVGYESLAAFNRAFKKRVGVPPGAWRTRERSLGPPVKVV